MSGRDRLCPQDWLPVAGPAGQRPLAQRQYLLATVRRVDSRRRLAGAAPEVAEHTGPGRADRSEQGGGGFGQRTGAFGGDHSGPNPTDRAKDGCKRHVVSDAGGIPLLVVTTPANVPDHKPLLEMIDALPAVRMPRGRPRRRPGDLVGDRAYGVADIIAEVLERRIGSLLAPRTSEHGSGLGKVRYVIERTMSWLGNFRRIKLCYERTGLHWQAFNELAACIICANRVAKLNKRKKAA